MADKRIYELVTSAVRTGKFFIMDGAALSNAEKFDAASLDTLFVGLFGDQIIGGKKTFNSDINLGSFADNGITVLDSGQAIITGSSATTPQLILSSTKVTNSEYLKAKRVYRWVISGSWGGSGNLDFHIRLGATIFNVLSIPNAFAGGYRAEIIFGPTSPTNSKAVCSFSAQGGHYVAIDTTGAHGAGSQLDVLMDMSSAAGSFDVWHSTLEAIN